MDVLIPLALLVVGLIIGFFVARYRYTHKDTGRTNKLVEKNIKEIMAQQAEHHIHQTRQTIEAIEAQCQALKHQVDEYDALLSQNVDDETPGVPYFGEQATTYLRNNLKNREQNRSSSVAGTQPRDFASTSSGVFVGSSGHSAAEKE